MTEVSLLVLASPLRALEPSGNIPNGRSLLRPGAVVLAELYRVWGTVNGFCWSDILEVHELVASRRSILFSCRTVSRSELETRHVFVEDLSLRLLALAGNAARNNEELLADP